MATSGLGIEGEGLAIGIAIASICTNAQAVSDDILDLHALSGTEAVANKVSKSNGGTLSASEKQPISKQIPPKL